MEVIALNACAADLVLKIFCKTLGCVNCNNRAYSQCYASNKSAWRMLTADATVICACSPNRYNGKLVYGLAKMFIMLHWLKSGAGIFLFGFVYFL